MHTAATEEAAHADAREQGMAGRQAQRATPNPYGAISRIRRSLAKVGLQNSKFGFCRGQLDAGVTQGRKQVQDRSDKLRRCRLVIPAIEVWGQEP